jgi:predicted  nucleic acid-binding Zn-ribbon protein
MSEKCLRCGVTFGTKDAHRAHVFGRIGCLENQLSQVTAERDTLQARVKVLERALEIACGENPSKHSCSETGMAGK